MIPKIFNSITGFASRQELINTYGKDATIVYDNSKKPVLIIYMNNNMLLNRGYNEPSMIELDYEGSPKREFYYVGGHLVRLAEQNDKTKIETFYQNGNIVKRRTHTASEIIDEAHDKEKGISNTTVYSLNNELIRDGYSCGNLNVIRMFFDNKKVSKEIIEIKENDEVKETITKEYDNDGKETYYNGNRKKVISKSYYANGKINQINFSAFKGESLEMEKFYTINPKGKIIEIEEPDFILEREYYEEGNTIKSEGIREKHKNYTRKQNLKRICFMEYKRDGECSTTQLEAYDKISDYIAQLTKMDGVVKYNEKGYMFKEDGTLAITTQYYHNEKMYKFVYVDESLKERHLFFRNNKFEYEIIKDYKENTVKILADNEPVLLPGEDVYKEHTLEDIDASLEKFKKELSKRKAKELEDALLKRAKRYK